jgi:DNA primase
MFKSRYFIPIRAKNYRNSTFIRWQTRQFEDVMMKLDDGEIEHVVEIKEYKVFQRIYLSLQEDESESLILWELFNDLINFYLQNEGFNLEQYLMRLQPEFAQVTDILMEDERLVIHWEGQNIFQEI